MSRRASAAVIVIRDRRWFLPLLLGALGAVASGVAFARAVSPWGAARTELASFVVCLVVAAVSWIGLRPRMVADHSGVRLRARFVPWREVSNVASPGQDTVGMIELLDGSSVELPRMSPAQGAELGALYGEARRNPRLNGAREGSEEKYPPPLRFPPMQRYPLPGIEFRAVGSSAVCIALVCALLWSQLPAVGQPFVPSLPRFPEGALKPVWTRYLPELGDVRHEAATSSGVFLLGNIPRKREMPWKGPPADLLERITPSGGLAWSRVVDPGGDLTAGASGVLLQMPRSRKWGGQICCDLTFYDNSGRQTWMTDDFKGVAEVDASGDNFVLKDRIVRQGQPEGRAEYTVLSSGGEVVSSWKAEGRGSLFGVDSGVVLSSYEPRTQMSRLWMYDLDGDLRWRAKVSDRVVSIEESGGSWYLTSDGHDWRDRSFTVWRLRAGQVVWSRNVGSAYHAHYLVTSHGVAFDVAASFGDNGWPSIWLQELDKETGDPGLRWQLATVRSGRLQVAGGVAYLFPGSAVQRFEWPPEGL